MNQNARSDTARINKKTDAAAAKKKYSGGRKKTKRTSGALIAAWVVFGTLVAGLAVVLTLMATLTPSQAELMSYMTTGTYYEGITVDGQSIAGLTYDEARTMLNESVKDTANQIDIEVKVETGVWMLDAVDVGLTTNIDSILTDAMKLGRSGTYFDNIRTRKALVESGTDYTISYYASTDSISEIAQLIGTAVNTPAVDASVRPDTSSDEPAFIYTEGSNGFGVNLDELIAEIKNSVESGVYATQITPELVYYEPDITVEDIQSNLVLRASFETSYGGAASLHTSARMRNIQKAARILNGCVVEDGATLSFNEYIGPRYEKDGWALAPGIVNGSRYVNQAGGGICQVSTTLYGALLKCGPELEIVERNRHSWPSSYTDYGLDATVSTGGPDLIFANNTGAP
ncbi:MAG: VanW family protein, partial [Clostridia bacterium]|nr:VanW family protein [Clostridia bacterium]